MSTKLEIIRLSNVQSKEVRWLWYPFIPVGKISMIQGDPGEGKTMLVLTLTAMLSKGLALPTAEEQEPMTVIYQTAEDGLEDTIKPRLEKAGADCERVVVINDSDNPLTFTDERLEQAIISENAKLLILDPLQAFLGPDADMHRANVMRPIFKRLAVVAERTKCAIIIVGHMNKMSGTKGMYRNLGSIDIPAMARSILLVGRTNGDDNVRYMAQLKNSLAPVGKTISFQISDSITFNGPCDITAAQLLGGGGNGSSVKTTKAESAVEELATLLELGELPCSEVYDFFEEIGISRRTVDNAKKELGVQSHKRSLGWYWSLPKSTPQQNL
jgi:hypothetical protein